MNTADNQSLERTATVAKPLALPKPEGNRRAQRALDTDSWLRGSLGAAFFLAVNGGSGFGMLPTTVSSAGAGLWCVAVASITAHCVGDSRAWQRGVADSNLLRRETLHFGRLAIVIAACASWRSGMAAVWTMGATAAIVLLTVLASYLGSAAKIVVPVLLLCVAVGTPWFMAAPGDAPWVVSAALVLAAAGVYLTARGADGSVNPIVAITRTAGIAYAMTVWANPETGSSTAAVAVAIAAVALDFLTARRNPFAAIIAAVACVHLFATPAPNEILGQGLIAQLALTTAEFLLLVVAGVRYVEASLWRLPAATYRVAPLCVVPRLDRAWDHPVKINVV